MNFHIYADKRYVVNKLKETPVLVLGNIFYNSDICIDKNDLNIEIWKFEQNSLANILNARNGFFAIISVCEKGLFAAVDRTRSIPLFYGRAEKDFFVSDDCEWLRDRLKETEMDPVSQEEFLLTGYVTGDETLFPGIKQLQAGEYLYAVKNTDNISVKTARYFVFDHKEPETIKESKNLFAELDKVVTDSVKRLLKYANGRQIVVPLSSGYDSKLIALKIKESGYENTICFTYGLKENYEANASAIVAGKLGYRWIFVEYSEALWRKIWNESERKDYFMASSGWTSLPHTQDWLAVKILKRDGLIDENAVFVPGHGGFVAGGHTPAQIEFSKDAADSIFEMIFNKHYNLMKFSDKFRNDLDFWKQRCLERIKVDLQKTESSLANAFEQWEWQERQSKFINNSVRVYEFWGYDWWLPLWDNDIVDFWLKMPLKYRKEKRFYKKYVEMQYEKLTGVKPGKFKKVKAALKNTIAESRLKKPLKFFLRCLRKTSDSLPDTKNTNAPYGKYDPEVIQEYRDVVLSPTGFGVFAFIAENIKLANHLSILDNDGECD